MPDFAPTGFALGVNLPWLHYAEDFGRFAGHHIGVSDSETHKALELHFQQIRDCGVSVVRWFLFGDGRGGFLCDNGIARAPDEYLFADMRAALELAERHRLRVCFSLIDYLWLQDHADKAHRHPHEHVLHFAAGREAFLLHVLIPLFREFREHPALYAWEIANEPEWAIREFTREPAAKLPFASFRAYADEIARAVHEFAHLPVTLGSARLMWLRAWAELPLDFLQAHFYPPAPGEPNIDLAQQLGSLANLKKPLWLGELPARDPSASGYSLRQALDLCREAGLCGAAVWRWTTPEASGTDQLAGQIDPAELQAWSAQEQSRSQSA